MFSNVVVEIPYQIFAATLVYVCWYFTVFGAHQSPATQVLMYLYCVQFYVYTSTFAIMVIAALPDAATGANIATLLFSMILTFDGVLQRPSALPGFWTFMWRVSPFTYLMGAWAGTALAGRQVDCSDNELAVFNPPPGLTCKTYLAAYFQNGAPGQLYNPSATSDCRYCPLSNGDQFLAASEVYASQKYRNLGIVFAYIGFNIFATFVLYYTFRVRRTTLLGGMFRRMKAIMSAPKLSKQPPATSRKA